LLCVCGIAAQNQPQQANSDQSSSTIRSTAQEVLLDMVFRDKKGKTIRDVRPEEIHILEDGVEQNLTSFRLIEGNAAGSVPVATRTTAAPVGVDPMREIRLVTLIFEGLDGEGKRFFRQALKDVLDMAPEQNLYFSVLTVDQKLHVIQPFTADHAALLKSVDRSMMWSFVQYETQSTEVKKSLKQALSGDEPQLQSSGSGGASPAQVQSLVNYRMAKMQYDMLQAAEAADRQSNARATIDALMALVRAQSQLPGRKVVLYFIRTCSSLRSSKSNTTVSLARRIDRTSVFIPSIRRDWSPGARKPQVAIP